MPSRTDLHRSRLTAEAEGYLFLEMAPQALAALDQIGVLPPLFQESLLRGLALRELCRFPEALKAFAPAFEESPDHVPLLVAMAWCHKRVNQVDQSIEMLNRAHKADPENALILYNLACYWAVAGNKVQSLSWLGRALRKDGEYRQLIPGEQDFDSLRDDPDFQFIAGLRDRGGPAE